MSTRTGMLAFQTPNCYPRYQTNSAVPFKRCCLVNDVAERTMLARRCCLDDVAEPDPAGLVGAELHVGDLLGRDEGPAPLLRVRRGEALGVLGGEGGGPAAPDLLGGRVALVHELARH